jgi:hypothetical protein
MAEDTIPIASTFALLSLHGVSMRFALKSPSLSDDERRSIALVRGDRFYTTDFTRELS